MVGLIVTSSKRAYGIPRSAAPRALLPVVGHCWPTPPQETCKHSKAGLAQSLCDLLLRPRFCLSRTSQTKRYGVLILNIWRVWGLILNISPLLPSCWGFYFAIGCGVSLSGGIQHSPVHGCSAASCNFGVLAGEDECTSSYSTILLWQKLLVLSKFLLWFKERLRMAESEYSLGELMLKHQYFNHLMRSTDSVAKTLVLGKTEKKGASEDEMAGWYHRLNGHECEQTPGESEGHGGLECCSTWGHKKLNTTGHLNNNNETSHKIHMTFIF